MGVIGLLLALILPAAPARAAQVRDLRIEAGGENRRATIVTPEGVLPGPAPVVIALHGAAQTPESFRAYFGLDAAAAAHGFIAVYPEGEGRVWNDGRPAAMRLKAVLRPGDDVAFLVALVRRLVADGIADPGRIYLTGISNGGFMVQRMACEHAELFAAYSSIMATAPANYREECQPARPVPIQFIHGTADSVIAYAGFWTPVGATLSAPDSAKLFARLNACGAAETRALPDLDTTDGTTAELRRWDGCRDNAAVELITIERGGHQSPARVETKPDLATPFLGLRSGDIDSGEEVWRFVSAFGGAGRGQPTAGPVPLPPPSPLRGARASGAARAPDQRGISTQ
ncbi:PHB depolymerase family esterase [Xanthobacter sp. V3C-3]|uniref:alpha/beta hydrolase family esterase n=1 Tax=Xanthobacter lutulentifluminis TaxID=3119935 RepID=UPI0037288135